MNKISSNEFFELLSNRVPQSSREHLFEIVSSLDFDFKLSRPRRTKLGDYRPGNGNYPRHRISINEDLNPWSFLITLIHELAHLRTYLTHGQRVRAHGFEWKSSYSILIGGFLNRNIFPVEIKKALKSSLNNPPASSCQDLNLMRILRLYDSDKLTILLEELPYGAQFKTGSGKMLIKGERIRKRYKCKEISTRRLYLFSPVAEVSPA